MAEAVGLAFGAAGLLTLFGACVDFCKQVQTARHFGDEFDHCYDILLAEQHRLAEWRELLVGYVNDRQRLPTERELEAVYGFRRRLGKLLEEVDDLFISYNLKVAAKSCDLAVHVSRQEASGGSNYAEYRTARDADAHRRHSQTSVIRKAQFAVTGLPKFRKLLEDIAIFRDHLEFATQRLIESSCNPKKSPIELRQPQTFIARDDKSIQPPGGLKMESASEFSRAESLIGAKPVSQLSWKDDDLNSPGPSAPDFSQTTPGLFQEQYSLEAPPSAGDDDLLRYLPEVPPDGAPLGPRQSSSTSSFSASSHSFPDDSTAPQPVSRARGPYRLASTSTTRSEPANLDSPNHAGGPPQPRRSTFPSSNVAASPSPPFSGYWYNNLIPNNTCVSSSVDGNRAAYLTADGVRVFDTTSVLAGAPRPTEYPRYEPRGAKWTGVAVAGPCLAVWGPSSAGTGLLIHVASQHHDSPHAEYQESFHFTTTLAAALGSEQEPRVALSNMGVVAFSDARRVVLRSHDGPSNSLPFPPARQQVKPRRVVDIAIRGDFLYCWVMHHTGPTQACLISWDLTDPTGAQLGMAATYKCSVGQDIHEGTLYPYSRGRGCIVGHSARTIFFPCTWPEGPTRPPTRGKACEQLKRSASEIRAVYVLENSSALVVRNPNKANLVLYQYPVLYDTAGKADIKGELMVKKLRLDARMTDGLTISATEDPCGGGQIAVVAASDGSVELVRLKR